MMRQIRFRGFNPLYGWLYGDLCHCGANLTGPEPVPIVAIVADDGTAMEVDPESVGQLTGLTDCHGVDIYEGDTLYAPRIGRMYEVCWSDGSFVARSKHYPTDSLVDLYGLLFDHQVVNYGCRREVMTLHGRATDAGRK